MNLTLAVCDPDMNVQPEDEERAGDHLKLFDEERVMRVVVNLLLFPERDWMRRGGDDLQTFFASQMRDDRAQARDVCTRFLHVLADARADFETGLNYLWLGLR